VSSMSNDPNSTHDEPDPIPSPAEPPPIPPARLPADPQTDPATVEPGERPDGSEFKVGG
jgi:hypothetical protein